MLRRWTLHATHPRYFGLFVPGTHEAGIWADALTALYNPQLGAWWHAPAASEIERHTLSFLAKVIDFEAETAHFTSGASEGNLTALLAAITSAFPEAAATGVGEAANCGKVYVSSQSHHSLHKAVRATGLGDRVLRVIPCNEHHQLDVIELRATLETDIAAGCTPIMIVGTIGTTTAGAIDDLNAIGAIAQSHGVWFHVDAAWGGAAGFLSSLRHEIRGVARADSLTWDAHKWLSVPMGAGMFFCRRPDLLARLFNVETGYVPEKSIEGDDLYLTSLQWSRRCIGLKVFLTLACVGRDGVRARIQRQLDVADYLRTRLSATGWRLANHTPLPLVCFTHPNLEAPGALAAVAEEVVRGGRAWISAATLPEGAVLRACITHDETSMADIDVLWGELESALARRGFRTEASASA
ncbi:MAG: Pyridoxal-dependent decarboxylase [Gemmatimonadetes bacterium]|nr:Pyridoxal-dependent decarboxylase [Gemmatimonadota bacterium]